MGENTKYFFELRIVTSTAINLAKYTTQTFMLAVISRSSARQRHWHRISEYRSACTNHHHTRLSAPCYLYRMLQMLPSRNT
jgi:hypothetical protein